MYVTHPAQEPAGDVVRIGLLAPLSGDVAAYGESVLNGFRLAVEEYDGRVGDFKIKYVVADDRNDAQEAVRMATKLITADQVSAIIGSLTSRCTIPVSELAQTHKVPLITPTASNPKVTMDNGQRRDYVFRSCFIDDLQGTVAARFALENLVLRTAAVLYDEGNDYTIALAKSFKAAFEKNGGKVVLYESYSSWDTDFTPVLDRVARVSPGALYLPDYYMNASLIGKQAKERGIKATLLGGDGWDSEHIDYNALEGGYFTIHWSPDDPRPEVKEWVGKYKARYGAKPDMFATLAYDATRILLTAVETAGSKEPAKIRDSVQDMKEYPAVTGRLTMGQNGNPAKPAAVMQVKGGQRVYITTLMP